MAETAYPHPPSDQAGRAGTVGGQHRLEFQRLLPAGQDQSYANEAVEPLAEGTRVSVAQGGMGQVPLSQRLMNRPVHTRRVGLGENPPATRLALASITRNYQLCVELNYHILLPFRS